MQRTVSSPCACGGMGTESGCGFPQLLLLAALAEELVPGGVGALAWTCDSPTPMSAGLLNLHQPLTRRRLSYGTGLDEVEYWGRSATTSEVCTTTAQVKAESLKSEGNVLLRSLSLIISYIQFYVVQSVCCDSTSQPNNEYSHSVSLASPSLSFHLPL